MPYPKNRASDRAGMRAHCDRVHGQYRKVDKGAEMGKGYKPQRKVYRLKFADDEYEGLEVMARSVSLGALLEFRTLASNASRNKFDVPDGATPEEIVAAAEAAGVNTEDALGAFLLLVNKFAEVLVSWNVEDGPDDEEEPVPSDLQGLLAQEPTFVMKIVESWIEVVAGVDTPLPKRSSSGETFPEESIPMEVS